MTVSRRSFLKGVGSLVAIGMLPTPAFTATAGYEDSRYVHQSADAPRPPRIGLFATGAYGLQLVGYMQELGVAGIASYIVASTDEISLNRLDVDEKILLDRGRFSESTPTGYIECMDFQYFATDSINQAISNLDAVILAFSLDPACPTTAGIAAIARLAKDANVPVFKVSVSNDQGAAIARAIASVFSTSDSRVLKTAIKMIRSHRGTVSDERSIERAFV